MTHSSQFTGGPTSQAMYDATRKRRLSGRRKRDHAEDITSLNITPMLDMMTIILIFLIKSYSTSTTNVNVANLVLPHSTTQLDIKEALQLVVTPTELIVDQRRVAVLEGGRIPDSAFPDGPGGYLIGPLYDALRERSAYYRRVQEFGGVQFEGRIAIVSDKSVAYTTLFKVLYTAGRADFGSFKLFVRKPE